MTKPQRQLDASIEIVTPENFTFEYRIAGPFQRLRAYLYDLAICILGFVLIGMATAWLLRLINIPYSWLGGLGLLAFFAVRWFYGGYFEWRWNGQTPGKRSCHLRVVSTDGAPITAMQAILRNVLRSVDGAPMFPWLWGMQFPAYQLGLLVCASNKRFQRIGDLASNTIVVTDTRVGMRKLDIVNQPEVVKLTNEYLSRFIPERSLSKAIAIYVNRRMKIHPERRMELASMLATPLKESLDIPAEVNPDLLLCAVYRRAFINDMRNQQDEPEVEDPATNTPPATALEFPLS